MKVPFERDFLNSVLSGVAVEEGDLQRLLAAAPKEGQLHDFKSGQLLASKKAGDKDYRDPRLVVREYVNGFANAEGGLLLVGVLERKGALPIVDGCAVEAIGEAQLAEWAKSTILDMMPYLGTPPRFQTVDCGGKMVLIVGVDRAPRLVPCVESRQIRYFFRMLDSTVEAPAYLVEDLVLGRRQRPALALKCTSFDASARGDSMHLECMLGIAVENEGLLSARDLQVGLITWSLPGNVGLQSSQIDRAVDAVRPRVPAVLMHLKAQPSNTRHPVVDAHPFELSGPFHVRSFSAPYPREPYTLLAAAYATADGHAPQWFELEIPMNVGIERPIGRAPTKGALFTPVHTTRPRVGWLETIP